MAEIVQQVFDAMQPLAQKNKITLQMEIPETLPPLQANAEQMAQLFTNLISNAIKFNKSDGNVRVSIFVKERELLITVNDSGIGIAKENLPRIFERFYRVDESRSKEAGGTGLGLAIAKHIVESHQGRIQADSVLGEGTKITVAFPC